MAAPPELELPDVDESNLLGQEIASPVAGADEGVDYFAPAAHRTELRAKDGGTYVPLHPEVYTFQEDFFEPDLWAALEAGTKEALSEILDVPLFGVFTFPCMTVEFCGLLVAELDHIRDECGWELDVAPNTMNRQGMILNQVGFEEFNEAVLERIVQPLAAIVFPQWTDLLKHHHTFTVKYAVGQDLQLARHRDNSKVTLNVNLGKEFEGATLFYQGVQPSAFAKIPTNMSSYEKTEGLTTLEHVLGRAVFHLGYHIHGANQITAGERVNYILWASSKAYD